LSNYNVPNDQNKYSSQQYNARPNGRNWQNNFQREKLAPLKDIESNGKRRNLFTRM
jgi:hypothetical protein